MATPILVNVSEKPQPKFKKYPMKIFEDDPFRSFSSIPNKVLPTKDTRAFIHGKMEEYNHVKLIDPWINKLNGDDH